MSVLTHVQGFTQDDAHIFCTSEQLIDEINGVIDFTEQVYKKMREAGIRVNLDDRSESMNYKIRESLQDKKIPYVCVIGDREIENNAVAVCARGIGQVGTFGIDEFISKIIEEANLRANESFAAAKG